MEHRFRGKLPVRFRADALEKVRKRRKPTAYAVWNDFWHEDITDCQRGVALKVMRDCPRHTFFILTKRRPTIPEGYSLPDNVWVGLTICNDEEAKNKLPWLLSINIDRIFLSLEPLLARVTFPVAGYGWVIVGCESGNPHRETKLEWVNEVVDKCYSEQVPVFVKQLRLGGKLVHAPNSYWLQIPQQFGSTNAAN